MTLYELNACLDRLGVKLSLRLVVDAPAGVMTPEVRTALVIHKPALLALLACGPSQARPDWERLSKDRWGPALGDPTPGIVIGWPVPGSWSTTAD